MARKTKFEARGLDELITSLGNASENLTKELGIAAWKAANRCKSFIAKEISAVVNMKQKDIKPLITVKRHRRAMSEVILSQSKRPSLKRFNPDTDSQGVSVQMFHGGRGNRYPRAFMGPKPGLVALKLQGHVWQRDVKKGKVKATKGRYKGLMRHPLILRKGVSPYAVFVKNNQILPTVAQTQNAFRVEIAERIRWLNIKKNK